MHIDDETLIAYLDGQLDEARCRDIEEGLGPEHRGCPREHEDTSAPLADLQAVPRVLVALELADQARAHLDVFGPDAEILKASVDFVLKRQS